ncbi:hypothetical protein J6590_026377 [Homalodisca vitripennis]|nr:hypothetical protein J6590_026377 [Homalodisca vitripennis]
MNLISRSYSTICNGPGRGVVNAAKCSPCTVAVVLYRLAPSPPLPRDDPLHPFTPLLNPTITLLATRSFTTLAGRYYSNTVNIHYKLVYTLLQGRPVGMMQMSQIGQLLAYAPLATAGHKYNVCRRSL